MTGLCCSEAIRTNINQEFEFVMSWHRVLKRTFGEMHITILVIVTTLIIAVLLTMLKLYMYGIQQMREQVHYLFTIHLVHIYTCKRAFHHFWL